MYLNIIGALLLFFSGFFISTKLNPKDSIILIIVILVGARLYWI